MDGMKVAQIFKIGPNEENWDYYLGKKIGKSEIIRIDYHQPQGEGDAHYCDIVWNTGNIDRVFRPDTIDFIKED